MKIRSFTVGLLASVMLSASLISCAIPPAFPTLTPPATQTPTLVFPSQTPAPTETPTPQSLLPPEVKEKFELAGVDLANMQNAQYDKDGLHITLPSGEVIVLTNDQLQKGMYNGQDNVLQYRDEANQNVIYAFDKETSKWEMEIVKEYPICTPENFRDCEIPVEELFDGTYFHWLEKQAKTLACSPNMRTDVKMVNYYDKLIVPDHTTAPNFKKPGSEFFIRDHTAGFAKFILPDEQEVHYAVMPLFMCDLVDRTKVYPIITVYSSYYPVWGQKKANQIFMSDGLRRWREDMRITAIVASDLLVDAGRQELKDPLVVRTFIENSDMEERFVRFVRGDFSALSQKGIVVLNYIATNYAGQFE